MEQFGTYFESGDDSLWGYLENTIYEMAKNDEEYIKLNSELLNLLNDHPNLRHVLEDDEVKELSEDDIKALIELKVLYLNIKDINMRNIFFLGGKNLYYYLKQMDLIK